MQYELEHTFTGQFGHFLVILAFASAILSFVGYFLGSSSLIKSEDTPTWKIIGRLGMHLHTISIFGVIATLFYMLANQYIEYEYIYKHTNEEMPFRYILVSFWGGQQGSMLLWAFWHVVLANLIRWRHKEWEAPVLTFIALIQIFISCMLLGVHIGSYKLGISPFALYRDADEVFGPYWQLMPDYLSFDPFFKQGNGLTPSLQNYWMIIHPPTLFLGFAATIVPFSFAMAGLRQGDLTSWVKPALSWTFFGVAVLGLGILMGGAWAYESLSFGGFWAWDPVENASFVPWIILVAAGHLMLITRKRKIAAFSTIVFTILSFLLILYSTFLTRSGILGDASVHSFTGDGMTEELSIFIYTFISLSIFYLLPKSDKIKSRMIYLIYAFLLFAAVVFIPREHLRPILPTLTVLFLVGNLVFIFVAYRGRFPKQEEEELLWTREFWMFVGALVLGLSALHIAFNTSITVINELFGTDMAPIKENRNAFYNKWQTPFALIVSLLVAFGQFLNYKSTPFGSFVKKMLPALIISTVITIGFSYLVDFTNTEQVLAPYLSLLFASIFAVVANVDYLIRFVHGKWNHAGSSVAHVGFGLVMFGTLVANFKQDIISENVDGQEFKLLSSNLNKNEDIQIFKGDTLEMGEYMVSFNTKDVEGLHIYFNMDYYNKIPKLYRQGTRIAYNQEVLEATTDHEAIPGFQNNLNHWKLVDVSNDQYFNTPKWSAYSTGTKAFQLQPHLQLNTNRQMAPIAEPGTQRFVTHDIFTHLKFAKQSPDEGEGYMSPYAIDGVKKIGDTIMTAGCKIIVDSVYDVTNPVERGLLATDQAVAVRLRVFELYDLNYRREEIIEPLLVKKDIEIYYPAYSETFKTKINLTQFKSSAGISEILEKIELNEGESHLFSSPNSDGSVDTVRLNYERLNLLKNQLTAKKLDSTYNAYQDVKIKLSIEDQEYVIMRAIIFPWINILWLGIIVMVIGTLMAVFHRRKQNGKAN